MAQLPPKIPPAMNQNWPTPFPPHQRMPSLTNIPDPSLPSATTATPTTTQQQPSWMEEFLDFSSTRRGSHRRSMSDSIAFLETPLLLDECRTNSSASPIGGNGHHPHIHVSSAAIINSNGFDRLDDEQLMSMFSDDHISVDDHLQPALPPASNPSTSSDQNSDNNNNNNMSLDQQHQQQPQPKIEPGEVDSSCNDNSKNNSPLIADQDGNQEDPRQLSSNGNTSPNDHSGPIDPKRVKRILANRQSAQRSRVRKLHYISELERSVTTLQTEVSALSPRVAFLDHQRLVLNVDNSALKQRIAALAQDKIFKDAHQEALKKEIERLRQIYHHQQQQQQQNTRTKEMSRCPANIAVAPPTSDANMVCTEKEQLMA